MLKEILLAVMLAESKANPQAISEKNAKGLMQVTPIGVYEVNRKYKETGYPNLFDPCQNIEYGVKLFLYYLREADYGVQDASIIYNGGYAARNYYRRTGKLYPESAQYLKRIKFYRSWLDSTKTHLLFDYFYSCGFNFRNLSSSNHFQSAMPQCGGKFGRDNADRWVRNYKYYPLWDDLIKE